jgi:hypothetical protein
VLPNLGPIITIHPKRTEPHLSHWDSGGKKLLKKENEKKRGDAEYKGSECYGVLFLDDSGLGSKDAAPATNRVEQPHSSVQTWPFFRLVPTASSPRTKQHQSRAQPKSYRAFISRDGYEYISSNHARISKSWAHLAGSPCLCATKTGAFPGTI